jgi:hypothetical protein
MAARISDLILGGEIVCTDNFNVRGRLKLKWRDAPLVFNLVGHPEPDLQGCHIRFQVREVPDDLPQMIEPRSEEEAKQFYRSFAWEQVGAAGIVTAARQVKIAHCSIEELMMRCKGDEPPPFEWKPCLTIEWYSQNGRVMIELADPIIEYLERPDAARKAAEERLAEDPDAGPAGLGIARIERQDDGTFDVSEELYPDGVDPEDLREPPDDPYGLFADDLQDYLDAQATDADRAAREQDEEVQRAIAEMELADDLLENSDGTLLEAFIETGGDLPDPDAIDDERAETELKCLVGQMALWGIALDICEHYTPRDAYRLLVTEILPNHRAHPELRGTGWVQHFMTCEHCPQCDAEAERQYREMQRRMRKDGPGPQEGGSEAERE